MESIQHNDILLESGTNELGIMEFTIAGQTFGINVAKVREILQYSPVTPMQNAHPMIEGVFKPRDAVITVVDLAKYLGLPPSENLERDIYMVSAFNNAVFAFHVHAVIGIDRISWSSIQKPDRIIYGGAEGVATGIAEYEDRLITILDFEKIVTEISPEHGINYHDLENLGPRDRSDKPILIAEDSMLLSKMLVEALQLAGYRNIIKTDNGKEAWEHLQKVKEAGGPILAQVAILVTDIEMPQIDGHRLTKLVKEDKELKEIPVILFSSLIDSQMRAKGEQLGADAQVTKPEIAKLVELIDKLTDSEDS